MSDLLEQLDQETLPGTVVDAFVHWCIWQQARPALLLILEKNEMDEVAAAFQGTDDYRALTQVAARYAHALHGTTGQLGLSAARAAVFEFSNMMQAASPDYWEPEAVAFFAARVYSWAGWAATDFSDPGQKVAAQTQAEQQQEATLARLMQQAHASS